MMGGGFGMGGGLGIILLLVIIALVVWAVMRASPTRQGGEGRPGEPSAEEVLRQRFARGEIDAEEYEKSLAVLRRSGEANPR